MIFERLVGSSLFAQMRLRLRGEAKSLFLPQDYVIRRQPEYFIDEVQGDIVHQPDVYEIAAFLARAHGKSKIVDIGCGHAKKLTALYPEFSIIGVDIGENIGFCRAHYAYGQWVECDLEHGILPISREILKDSVLVCSDVIEHLLNPLNLLILLRKALDVTPVAVVSTPERDLVRGTGDLGPPANSAHVREWNLIEFRRMLGWAGLPAGFVGLTFNNSISLQKRTILAMLDPLNAGTVGLAPDHFRALAILATHNEVDIVVAAIEDMLSQGLEVYVIDNWSTDGTYEAIMDHFGDVLAGVERFPSEAASSTYDWHAILRRKEELAVSLDADWFVHMDTDEIRRAPWSGVRMRDALYHVDQQGYSAIDHTVVEFRPTDDSFSQGCDHRDHFRYLEFCTRPGCFMQQKSWKRQSGRVNLADTGGHEVGFAGKRVFPYKFLLKHYPYRNRTHGVEKLTTRLARLNQREVEEWGWHEHLRRVDPDFSSLWKEKEMIEFGNTFWDEFLGERLTGVGLARGS